MNLIMERLRIFKNDWESIVIEWRGEEVGYISIGKHYIVTLYLKEYFVSLKHKDKLKEWITQILINKEFEAYSITQLEKKGKKVIG